jgi:hypothetical protein
MAIALPYSLEFQAVPHRYLLNGNPVTSVTQILDAAGLSTAGKAFYRPEHALRGTAVHTACQYDDEGDLGKCPEELLGYVNAWRKFRAETGFYPTHIELALASQTYQYAGMIDRVGILNDALTLVDLKSGAFQAWHALQLAGYWQLLTENMLALELPAISSALVVCVSADGSYKTHDVTKRLSQAKNVFLSAVNVAHWKEQKAA